MGDILADAAACFSQNYFEAREKFLAAGANSIRYLSPARGPADQDLFTDVAWFGHRDARRVGILICGTHGVEGYCGSAAQIDWMRRESFATLASGEAMLLVHSINPYGFAWDRRVTEEGCDLNRNFVDFRASIPLNQGYDELADSLVPVALEGPAFEAAESVIRAYRKKHGEHAFQVARKSGQYRHPSGMFFGGFGPSAARRTLETIAADFDLAARDLVIIVDTHTGLGPFGYGELQTEQASGLTGYRRAVCTFRESVTSPDLGTSSSIALHGTMDEFWQRLLGERHIFVCLEFGTYDHERGRRVLREDHWLQSHPEADPALAAAIRASIRQHYDPPAPDWREMVLCRSRDVQRQVLEGLRQPS